jgi:hypothetical protein
VNRTRTFEIRSQRANHIADLFSRYTDLTFAYSALGRVIELLRAKTEDADAVRAYWGSAMIAYGRAFGKGRLRTAYGSTVMNKAVAGHDKMHESIIWRRDKEVAHAVESVFNEVVVGATLERQKDKVRFDGVGVRDLRVFAPEQESVETIHRHVQVLTARLANAIKSEMSVLSDDVDHAFDHGTKILGRDVSAMFLEGGNRMTDPLGLSLELTSHEVARERRKASGRTPCTD